MVEKKKKTPGAKPRSFAVRLLINLCCMAALGFVIVWLALTWLDVWTDHGDETVTPTVEGMSLAAATTSLEAQGFTVELLDSIYDNTRPPGTVTDQNPKAGSVVKSGREIYLTITAFNPKMVTLPKLTDVSERQARAMLAGLGVKKITTMTVPSEFKDLVTGVLVDNALASAGQRVPVTAAVTLQVGSGPSEENADSTAAAPAADESVEMNTEFFD